MRIYNVSVSIGIAFLFLVFFFTTTHFSWDVRSGKCVMNVATKGENINIDWSPDGKTIAVGNKEDLGAYPICVKVIT